MDIIHINVGGREFLTYRSTIRNIPDSYLTKALDSKDHYNSDLGCYFFDRSADNFSKILEAYRKGHLHLPDDVCGLEMVEELEYWNLPTSMVAPCCTERLQTALHEQAVAKGVREEISVDCDKSLEILARSTGWRIYQIKLWMFMQLPVYSSWAKVSHQYQEETCYSADYRFFFL
jgi:hypothetical protein